MSKLTEKLNKLVLVKWVDASGGGSSWENADNITDEDMKLSVIYSVGWILKQNDNAMLLIANHNNNKDGELKAFSDMLIPLCCVLSVDLLVCDK